MTDEAEGSPRHSVPRPDKHSLREDILALVIGVFFCSLGLLMLKQHGIITGGMAGLGLLLSDLSGFSFGITFFVINLPFYAFGWKFLLKTFISIASLSVATHFLPVFIGFESLDPTFASMGGGLLIGTSLLIFFRHGASLGGVGILAVWLYKRYGPNTGTFQFIVDAAILSACLTVHSFLIFMLSILSIIAINVVIGLNHKPGRYQIT